MNDSELRAMKDQHARDEAALRRSQQVSAGGEHQPVEAYPPHGSQSSAQDGLDDESTVRQYEQALAQEKQAWSQVNALPGRNGFDAQRWEYWRCAVEERDRATRLLINHAMTRPE